jgi:hypothetical protein
MEEFKMLDETEKQTLETSTSWIEMAESVFDASASSICLMVTGRRACSTRRVPPGVLLF